MNTAATLAVIAATLAPNGITEYAAARIVRDASGYTADLNDFGLASSERRNAVAAIRADAAAAGMRVFVFHGTDGLENCVITVLPA